MTSASPAVQHWRPRCALALTAPHSKGLPGRPASSQQPAHSASALQVQAAVSRVAEQRASFPASIETLFSQRLDQASETLHGPVADVSLPSKAAESSPQVVLLPDLPVLQQHSSDATQQVHSLRYARCPCPLAIQLARPRVHTTQRQTQADPNLCCRARMQLALGRLSSVVAAIQQVSGGTSSNLTSALLPPSRTHSLCPPASTAALVMVQGSLSTTDQPLTCHSVAHHWWHYTGH